MRTSQHQYGPHQPEAAPNAVTILQGGRRQGTPIREVVVPLPAALVRQREQLNQRAHFAAILAHVAEPCPCDQLHSGACSKCGARRG